MDIKEKISLCLDVLDVDLGGNLLNISVAQQALEDLFQSEIDHLKEEFSKRETYGN